MVNRCDHDCEKEVNHTNKLCYKATCFGTSRHLAKILQLKEGNIVYFSVKIGKNHGFNHTQIQWKTWEKGMKRVLVFPVLLQIVNNLK